MCRGCVSDARPLPVDEGVRTKREFCSRHLSQRLEMFYDIEIENTFGSGYGNVRYCGVLECDFVKPDLRHTRFDGERDYLIYMTAARQKAFSIKFVRHFVGDGK